MGEWLPPREYLINQFVSRVPWAGLRIAGYRRLGVTFEAPRTTMIMLWTDVHAPREITIGGNTAIGRHCHLDGRGGLEIGRNVNISSFTRIITAGHDPYDAGFRGYSAPVVIHDRVWIATGVTILAGVTIGEGAAVAAGAVVNKDVEPFTVVGGIPAKEIGQRPRDLTYEIHYRPNYL